MACLFWRDRKHAKARKWLQRATKLRPDHGDAWAYAYKLELEAGAEEAAAQILKECTAAEPNRGERWCATAKARENRQLGPEDVLKKVSAAIAVA